MAIAVKNITGGQLTIGNVTWAKGETKNLNFLSRVITAAITKGGVLSTTGSTLAFGAASASLTTLTAANGTPVAPVAGAATIVAVTDFPTAANAVATIVAELNRHKIAISGIEAAASSLQVNGQDVVQPAAV